MLYKKNVVPQLAIGTILAFIILLILFHILLKPFRKVETYLYDAEKNYIGMSYGSQFVTEPTPIRVVYTLNENDFINSLDLSAYAGYYATEESKVAHFMRFCSKAVIDENSIITVNEPIE